MDTILAGAVGRFKMGWPDAYEERALAECARNARGTCVIVTLNGDYKPVGLSALAARLGSKQQAEVRTAFLRGLERRYR